MITDYYIQNVVDLYSAVHVFDARWRQFVGKTNGQRRVRRAAEDHVMKVLSTLI